MNKQERSSSPASVQRLVGRTDLLYARLLLQHLWSRYDAGGESMGRSFNAMLLELSMELLGTESCPEKYKEPGVLLDEVKTILSSRRLAKMSLPNVTDHRAGEPPAAKQDNP